MLKKKIKKLIIHKVEVIDNIFDFNAFPGHVIKIKKTSQGLSLWG